MKDRVGLGWRPEIAAATLAHAERVDVVEVLADEWFGASRRRRRTLATLNAQVPLVLHGVSMGLASAEPIDGERLRAMARLVDAVRPEAWSEHLAFVRAGGIEIGHLAAPPRSPASIEDLRRNAERAADVVGSPPWLENVATLVAPPGGTLGEAEWIARALDASGCELLLDLHNLHANAANFGFDARGFLDEIPLERVRAVHLAGGRRIGGRILDDHLHDVPPPVYELLVELAARAPNPLTVILERDGAYPAFEHLLAQLDAARAALAEGRKRLHAARSSRSRARWEPSPPSDPRLNAFLARIYVDSDARARFLGDPSGAALAAGLDPDTANALERVDREGLELASRSFAHKRTAHAASG